MLLEKPWLRCRMGVNASELRGAAAMLFLLRPHDGAAGTPRRGPQACGRSAQAEAGVPRSDGEKGLYPGADRALRCPENE